MSEEFNESLNAMRVKYPDIDSDCEEWARLLKNNKEEKTKNARRRQASDVPIQDPAAEEFQTWIMAMKIKYEGDKWKDILGAYEGMRSTQRDQELMSKLERSRM